MATIDEMRQNVPARLLYPRPGKPSPRLILKEVSEKLQSVLNRLSNTGKAWAVGETSILTSTGQEDYQINADKSFGKPLHLVTIDRGNPAHIERDVNFFEAQNLNFDWRQPNDVGNAFFASDGSDHTALRVAFFRTVADGVFARFKPIPQAQAEYRLTYLIGAWAQMAGLDDSPVLAEHHQLIEVKAALALLPACEWYDDEKENRARRKELAESLAFSLRDYQMEFDAYVKSLRQDRLSMRSSGLEID